MDLSSSSSSERNVRVRLQPAPRMRALLVEYGVMGSQDREEHPTIALPTTLASRGITAVVVELLKEERSSSSSEGEATVDVQEALKSFTCLAFRHVSKDLVLPGNWTLEKFLRKNELSEEEVMVMEYDVPLTMEEPRPGPSVELTDWLSCVASLPSREDDDDDDESWGALAGSFDGSLVLARSTGNKGELVSRRMDGVHLGPIKAIRVVRPLDYHTRSKKKNDNVKRNTFVFAGSKDSTVSVHRLVSYDREVADDSAPFARRVATCYPDEERSPTSIEGLDVAATSDDPNTVLLATGAWDAQLRLYQVDVSQRMEEEEEDDDDDVKKRQKSSVITTTAKKGKKRLNEESSAAESVASIFPIAALVGHADKISGVRFGSRVDAYTVFTSSWDQTVRCWDAVRECETATLRAPKPCTCLDFSFARQLLAAGQTDHAVRLFDARASGDAIVKLTLSGGGHRGWVSCVSFLEEGGSADANAAPEETSSSSSSPLLASVAYDRTVCVWDVRGGAVPLHVIKPDLAGRLFACGWGGEASGERRSKRLWIGGTDAHLRSYYV